MFLFLKKKKEYTIKIKTRPIFGMRLLKSEISEQKKIPYSYIQRVILKQIGVFTVLKSTCQLVYFF